MFAEALLVTEKTTTGREGPYRTPATCTLKRAQQLSDSRKISKQWDPERFTKEMKEKWQTCMHHRIRFFQRLRGYKSSESGYF